MKKVVKKRMSIEDLAFSMRKGFKSVNEKIAGVDNKVAGVDNKVAGVDNKVAGVDNKIDNVTDLVDKLAASTLKGFEKIEAKMATKADLSTQKIHGDVLQVMLKEIKAIHGDSKSFKDNISTLFTDHVAYDRKIENLTVRVEKIELSSGNKL